MDRVLIKLLFLIAVKNPGLKLKSGAFTNLLSFEYQWCLPIYNRDWEPSLGGAGVRSGIFVFLFFITSPYHLPLEMDPK